MISKDRLLDELYHEITSRKRRGNSGCIVQRSTVFFFNRYQKSTLNEIVNNSAAYLFTHYICWYIVKKNWTYVDPQWSHCYIIILKVMWITLSPHRYLNGSSADGKDSLSVNNWMTSSIFFSRINVYMTLHVLIHYANSSDISFIHLTDGVNCYPTSNLDPHTHS